MARMLLFLLAVFVAAIGLYWLGNRPGSVVIDWQEHVITLSVFRAVVISMLTLGAGIVLWSIGRQVWRSPATVGHFINRRREKKGLDAISSGLIAIGSGDRALATRAAVQARKSLPNEPLTHILRAQAAQLSGDRTTARRIFDAMLASPDTEQLGLRGLFLEAEREGETEAARQYAQRALDRNTKLDWPVHALFDLQCKAEDWAGALETLSIGRRSGHIEKSVADRRRAVLLTAQADTLEDGDAEQALALASEANGLAPDLIPAAAIAGRIHASRGATAKAAKVIQRTWKLSPHPDLAKAYAFARPGDSPRDRLERIRQLAALTPNDNEGPIALAETAVEARDFETARAALAPLLDSRLTQRVAKLMARIESEQHQDAGRVREWLARTVNAPRDPVWVADGMVSDRWSALSPVTKRLDAVEWKVAFDEIDGPEGALLTERIEELVALGTSARKIPAPMADAAMRHETASVEIDARDQPETTPPLEMIPPPAAKRLPVEDAVEIRTGAPRPTTRPSTAPLAANPASTPARGETPVAQTNNRLPDANPNLGAARPARPIQGERVPRAADQAPAANARAPDDPGPEPVEVASAPRRSVIR